MARLRALPAEPGFLQKGSSVDSTGPDHHQDAAFVPDRPTSRLGSNHQDSVVSQKHEHMLERLNHSGLSDCIALAHLPSFTYIW